MKILIVSKWFAPRTNTRATQMGRVTAALQEAGCEVRLLAGLDAGLDGMREPGGPTVYCRESRLPDCSGMQQIRSRLWVRRAARAAAGIIRDFGPDIIMTASTPYESHWAGLTLQRNWKIPWAAYFSDPCPASFLPEPYRSLAHTNVFAERLRRRIVRATLAKSNGVIMTSRHGLEHFEAVSGVAIAAKGHCIPHIGGEAAEPGGRNRMLVHIGDLHRRTSRELLSAAARMHKLYPDEFDGVLFVGSDDAATRRLISEMRLEDCVFMQGRVPEAEAAQIATGAGALLLIEADMIRSPFLPSKLADYAMTGWPILAITPEHSATRDYLQRLGGGIAVSRSENEIFDALEQIFVHGNGQLNQQASSTLRNTFLSKRVAAEYIKIFARILDGI